MKRAFKYVLIGATNVSQPLIGTTLTAAIPAGLTGLQNFAVADSSFFQPGDWMVIGSAAAGDEERLLVNSVPDATHIKLQKREDSAPFLAHANGAPVRLSILVNNVYVQSKDGNVAPLFVGIQGVLTDGTKMIAKIQNVAAGQQPTDFKDAFTSDSGPNPIDIGEIWIAGTVNDQYLPSLGVV